MKRIALALLALSSLALIGCTNDGHSHKDDTADTHHAHSTAAHSHTNDVEYKNTCSGMQDAMIVGRGIPDAVTIADEGSSYSTMYWYDDEYIRFEFVSDFSGKCQEYEFVYVGYPNLRGDN